MDGFELLRRLRTQHLASRVLLLTARSEVNDRVTGLQLGADDYLPKPFAMRELVARVRALGRRYPEEPSSPCVSPISRSIWLPMMFIVVFRKSSYPRAS